MLNDEYLLYVLFYCNGQGVSKVCARLKKLTVCHELILNFIP
jgi:hypothetical protein